MKILAQSEFKKVFLKYFGDGKLDKTIIRTINHFVQCPFNGGTEIPHEFQVVNARDGMKTIRAFEPSSSDIQMVLLGENHQNDQDRQRGKFIIDNLDSCPESLVVFERKMTRFYDTAGKLSNHTIVREDNIYDTNIFFDTTQRSMIMAGYLVACIAQMSFPVNVVLFYGENHRDILETYFDYFARHTAASFLLAKTRKFYLVRSFD